ncbi:MAG: enoyl-CoA hydratase/isomerase family protein [Magnetococcales bacterium]|nr:enoyl-CoA hydratase/isomerase family protein [Magnetococcales bacterium]
MSYLTTENNKPYKGRHWCVTVDTTQIAWVTLDMADHSSNLLNESVLDELDALLPILEQLKPRGAVFRSGKKSGFIAGADIREFNQFKSYAEARHRIRSVLPVFRRLEELPFPTVAQISGYCLGGGLELALCCRYRVAEESDRTRLGLPEVKLGIHPGFGGTVRLPRLIGDLPALELILTGKTLSARQAKKCGLVDWTVPSRHLNRTVIALIDRHPVPHRPSLLARLPGWAGFRPLLGPLLEKKLTRKAPLEHYPAPHAVLDLWRHGANLSKTDRLQAEVNSIARLFTGATAQNLIRLFLLGERMKGLGKGIETSIKHIHVIGAGVMGGDIAAWCAWKGLRVTLEDAQEQSISNALQRADALFNKKSRDRRLVQAAMDRLIPDQKGYGMAKADVVIEAIFENLKAKQTLLQQVEPCLKKGAILATNTSSICLEEMATVLQEPGRFVGIHFFNPVAYMPLIEIVRGRETSEQSVRLGCAFATTIGRTPLPVKSGPGFLINRLLMPYLSEGIRLVAEGISAKEVDRAAKGFGMPMGPLTLADMVGLDICLSVSNILHNVGTKQSTSLLKQQVDQGYLGKKTGRGFYEYTKGKQGKPAFGQQNKRPADTSQRIVGALLNETVAALTAGVVEDTDLLDAGVVFGTGFSPFRGGPIRYIATDGKEKWIETLEKLEKIHGPRFTPHPGWRNLQLPDLPVIEEKNHAQKNGQHHISLAGSHPTGVVPGTY